MANSSGGVTAQSTAEQPPTQRRPRVKEVSSRFMSPLVQSNSTPIPASNFPQSKSVLRRQPSRIDENHAPDQSNRSFDKSSIPVLPSTLRRQHLQRTKIQSKENEESTNHHHYEPRFSSRPDTPMTIGSRIVPSRYRQVSNSVHRSNSMNKSSDDCAAVTAAARLLQDVTSDAGTKLSRISTSRDDMVLRSSSSSNDGSSSCPNSPLCVSQNVPDSRASMPDVEKWRAERNSRNGGKLASDCARSLIMPGGNSLPPHPLVRHGFEAKKGKKVPNHQEDVHSLKMLANHYLQWQFVNAKAEASMKAQKQEAEKKIFSLGDTISNMRDRVKIKRNELAVLRRIKNLTMVVKAQTPYLDEWATIEEDYINCLSGTTNALLSSSIRIPVNGDVRADIGEVSDALSSALKMIELIGFDIQRFMTKAEEMDTSVSDLAKMASGERVLIQECGDLLSKTHILQVKECSLRSSVMQADIIKTRDAIE